MDKIAELRAKRAGVIDKMAALVAKMNADAYVDDAADETAYAELKKEVASLEAKIARAEETNKLVAATARPIIPTKSGIILPPGTVRSSKLKNFKGENAELRALRFGKFCQASIFGLPKAHEWCRENGIELKAHSEGVNSAGGYFVPEEFSMDIIDLRDSYGMFRQLCQVMPMGRDTITVPRRVSGLTAYPVGEGVAITASQTGWDQVRLTAAKWGVLTLLSSELDEDAVINLGDMLVGEIAYAFAVAEDTAGFSGDGSGNYHGITGLLTRFTNGVGSLAGAVDAASGHDTFAEYDAADLNKVMAALPQYVYKRGTARWYCSQVAWALTFQRLIQAAGGLTKDDITGEFVYRYMGFPVMITPSMPTSQADISDTAVMLFGDIALACTFGDRRGMTVARSTEYKFAEDQIAIKATERFDINVHDIGSTTVAGPVVALMAE